VNEPVQTTVVGEALTFAATPLIYGTSLAHADGAAEITITEPGVYRADFNSSVSSTAVSENLTLRLLLNGAALPGAVAYVAADNTGDFSGVTVQSLFAVGAVPATLTVVPETGDFDLAGSNLIVIRLNDNEA
jgi:hypothetical protein